MQELTRLADLLHERNAIDARITEIIHRPATQGHIGEYIASQVFGIGLAESANNRGVDGQFLTGRLAGRSVDVKFYGKQDGLLAIQEEMQPDYFLVLTGPRSPAGPSRGMTRLCVIEHVYLFDGKKLADEIKRRGVKFGVAASVQKALWEEAEIYPAQRNTVLILSEEQRQILALFGSRE